MKKISIIVFLTLLSTSLFSQTVIKMKRQSGVSIIPCKINGIDLELIFDTGASDVSISLNEAASMLKNGKLTKSDIIGTANYQNANGDITEGFVINIKEIEIAGLKMTNIKASVVKNLDAPLLLGQTAIKKLGKIQIDLNNNTLTILNGRGTYDYTTYSLTDKLNKFYKDFLVFKIEKKDNNEGLFFSYTVPKKFKEEKVTNDIQFKTYLGEEYPLGYKIGFSIGLQTLPILFNNFELCEEYVKGANTLSSNLNPSIKLISSTQTNISYCKTIKNIIFLKDDDIYTVSHQYWVFCGNKCLSFIYSIHSSEKDKIISISSDFEDFCNSQISNLVIYNAFENAATCKIEYNAIENKKDIDIVVNNSCKWFISERNADNLRIINKTTSSSLSFSISDKSDALNDFENMNSENLLNFKNTVLKGITNSKKNSVPQEILTSDIITIKKRKYLYLSAKSKSNNNYILTECYYYVLNSRLITIFSLLKDEDENKLEIQFQKTQKDFKDLLNEVEIIGKKTETPIDYFDKGLAKAKSNDFKDAITDFDKAILLNPKLVEAFYNRGIAKFKLQYNKSAIEDFDKAISLNPIVSEFYYNRAIAKSQVEDYQGAYKDYNIAISLKPDFSEAYLNRGLLKIVLGTNASGCIDLKKASELGLTNADRAIKVYCK